MISIQPDLIELFENVWESKYPCFCIYYNNDVISKCVNTRMIKTYDLEKCIKNIVRSAKLEYKDVVFYKYNKWETTEDNERTFIRYCYIERETGK